MSQSLAKVLIHVVFSTKYRYPFLAERGVRHEMHAYLGGTCNGIGCPVLSVGGAADHVHVVCRLSRNITMAKAIGDIKRSSSKWIKSKGKMLGKFAWQNGYGAFSVGESELERVLKYVEGQEEHHQKKTFQDEYRLFLREYGVEYDERFVWD